MPDFPHLKLPFKVEGSAKPPSGGSRNKLAKERTDKNKENRINHGKYLDNSANVLLEKWKTLREKISAEGIVLPNENDIPVFLKIDTEVFNIDKLKFWGIELISEEEDGCIIGASNDNLQSFIENVNQFLNEKGQRKDKASQIWELETDESRRIEKLLKGEIGGIWETLKSDVIYTVQLGVSCYIPNVEKYPVRVELDSEISLQQKVVEFKEHITALQVERDTKQRKREVEIEGYIGIYGGELHDIWDNEVDAVYF